MRDELLGYYERELIFLRRMGAEFARRYPKIAARLQLEEEKIEDPHVERMIESFAFLTGRIGLKLADELPEITESFLNLLIRIILPRSRRWRLPNSPLVHRMIRFQAFSISSAEHALIRGPLTGRRAGFEPVTQST